MNGHSDRLESLGTPEDVIRRWPRSRPLVALCSAPPEQNARHNWARRSILAEPAEVVRIAASRSDPLGEMFRHVRATARPDAADDGESTGGWVVALAYELGRVIEPRSRVFHERTAKEWPWSIVMWRCPGSLVYDHGARSWAGADRGLGDRLAASDVERRAPFRLGPVSLAREQESFTDAVGCAVELIHAGDVFEVNLSHRLRAECGGSTRSLFLDLFRRSCPWYGAYLELSDAHRVHAALSMSPELFLQFDSRSRRVVSRPIKGTRHAAAGAGQLRKSPKDRAELNMIVDLMRNDLGRVSRFGSVNVVEDRAIEHHGAPIGDGERGVLHGVATVEGMLRDDADLESLLRATFPAGSISGAPKVRAMQIIEELEATPRGLYTGAIGFINDRGDATFNVAIRTAVVHGRRDHRSAALDEVVDGTLWYGVGAGIVADSDPEAEFEETLDKAGVLPGSRPVSAPRKLAQARSGG